MLAVLKLASHASVTAIIIAMTARLAILFFFMMSFSFS
jgi:hypothetical protein